MFNESNSSAIINDEISIINRRLRFLDKVSSVEI